MKDTPNILYLKNDEQRVERVQETLAKEGIRCNFMAVDSKLEFKKVLEAYPIDLILASYDISAHDGDFASEIARNLCPEIPVIFLSGKTGTDSALEEAEGGVEGNVLEQGFDELLPAVRGALHAAEERRKRIKAERALARNEEKFRALVETTSDWVWETDLNGVFTYAGPRVIDLLGYEQEEVVGRQIFDFLPQHEKEKAAAFLKECNSGPRPFSGFEIDHFRKSGQSIAIEISGIPVVDENENHIGWSGFNRDVTERKKTEKALKNTFEELGTRVEERTSELIKAIGKLAREVEMRKQAEQALRESRERYRDLVETIHDVIWEVNRAGVYTYISPRAGDILGKERAELIGKSFYEHMPPEEAKRINHLLKGQFAESKSIDLIEIRQIHEDGSTVFLESSGKPFFDDSGKFLGYRGAYRDITERKKIEDAMQKSKAELQHLSSQLMSVHEKESKRIGAELHDGIAQTVSAVKMRAEIALMQQEKHDTAEVRASLESIIDIAQGAVEEIRRISRNLRPSMLDNLGILPTVSWLCREFESSYPLIKVQEEIALDEDEVPIPLKTIVFRILQESLNNIAKHSQATHVRLSLTRADGSIDVTVEDNGLGFDMKKVGNDETSLRGLGLTSMKERAELLNGKFSVASLEGEGTTVRASWPVNGVLT